MTVAVVDRHDAAIDHDARERDDAGCRLLHRAAGLDRQVDAAMAGPAAVRGRLVVDHAHRRHRPPPAARAAPVHRVRRPARNGDERQRHDRRRR